jgi:hypothetical protein
VRVLAPAEAAQEPELPLRSESQTSSTFRWTTSPPLRPQSVEAAVNIALAADGLISTPGAFASHSCIVCC